LSAPMSEPWLIYALIVLSVAIAVQLAQAGVRGIIRQRRWESQRFGELDQRAKPAQEIDMLRKRARSGPAAIWIERLRRLLVQSGTGMTFGSLARIWGMVWLVLSIALPLPWSGPLRLLAAGLAAGCLLYAYLRYKRSRRIARFGEQLPDIIDVIVRSLRAGHPLPISLALVAREMPQPAGPEFAAVVDEINYGRSIGEAMELLEKRIGYRELRFLVSSIVIAQQTGGNMAEILARLAQMLRDRFRLTRKVRALSAEGRFSGYALSAMPILLFGLINLVSASYYADFWQSSAKTPVLLVAGVLLLLGNVVIYKMVHFKV